MDRAARRVTGRRSTSPSATSAPTSARPLESHMPVDRAWTNAPSPARPTGPVDPSSCWNSAPSAATPKVAPTMRFIDRIHAPTPALFTLTEFMAALDMGDIVNPSPTPRTRKAGSRRP